MLTRDLFVVANLLVKKSVSLLQVPIFAIFLSAQRHNFPAQPSNKLEGTLLPSHSWDGDIHSPALHLAFCSRRLNLLPHSHRYVLLMTITVKQVKL